MPLHEDVIEPFFIVWCRCIEHMALLVWFCYCGTCTFSIWILNVFEYLEMEKLNSIKYYCSKALKTI